MKEKWKSEASWCTKCDSRIVWHILNDGDMEFSGVMDKINHHQVSSECKRKRNLDNLLGKDENVKNLNLTFLD